MTTDEAAAALGLAPATIRRQIYNGRLRAEKHGGVWWVTDEEVERYRREVLGRMGRKSSARPSGTSETLLAAPE